MKLVLLTFYISRWRWWCVPVHQLHSIYSFIFLQNNDSRLLSQSTIYFYGKSHTLLRNNETNFHCLQLICHRPFTWTPNSHKEYLHHWHWLFSLEILKCRYIQFIINYKCFHLAECEYFFSGKFFHMIKEREQLAWIFSKNHVFNSLRPTVIYIFKVIHPLRKLY